MPLESISRLMQAGARGHYAIGYFEAWNLESLQGVIDAAEQTRSPVIIGFNGGFLSRPAGAREADLAVYAALGVAGAAGTSVPCGFIFNECPDDAWVERAIGAGFNLVMPADPNASLENYARRVKRLTEFAHERGVAVEADFDQQEGQDPTGYAESAAQFVNETGVDLLSIHVGNEEVKLEGRVRLDLTRLEAVHQRVSIPLVLHGGTGIEDHSIREAIRLGVRKINYGTYIKQRYLAAVREALSNGEPNPHALLGNGSDTDMMVVGRRVVRDAVLERIALLGCCGKAF